VLRWSSSTAHGVLIGGLARDGHTVVLDGDIRDCAAMAVWLRRLVPPAQAMVFYDEGYSASGPLEAATQPRTIVDLFASDPIS